MPSFKNYNHETNKWETIAGGGSSKQTATQTPITDDGEYYDSSNVEGALQEIGHYMETNVGGGGSAMPTIKSEFEITKSDGISSITIPIFYTSPNLGEGTCYITINNIEVGSQTVQQGNNNIIVPPLGAGKNIIVSLYVKDRAGLLSNQLNWTVSSGGISITMLTDTSADYGVSSRIVLRYNINCMTDEDIIVHLTVDGTEYQIKGINGYNTHEITGLTIGVHEITYYAESGEYSTKLERFTLVVVSNDVIYISSTFDQELEYESGIPINIPFRVSIDSDEYFQIDLYIDEVLNKTLTSKPTNLFWTIPNLDAGEYTLKIKVSNEILNLTNYLELQCKVVQGEYKIVKPITDGSLLAWFDATQKTNNDTDRDTWVDVINGNVGKLYNFNYGVNGWLKQDGKDLSQLVMTGTSYVEFDMTPFKDNFRNGGVVEILFRTRDVGNSGARVLDITDVASPYKGVYIDTAYASLSTEGQKITAGIGEEEYIHCAYVIDRINTFCHIYINGVLNRSCKLTDSGSGTSAILESLAHNNKMYLNCRNGISDFGACEVVHLRIYDREFSHDEVLQNYISTIDDISKQKEISNFNSPSNTNIPYMNIVVDEEKFKDMTDVNKIEVSINYTSPNQDLFGSSFTAPNSLMYWQGTSSLGYVLKNYNIVLRDEQRQEIQYSPFSDCVEQSLFCLKCNYMESTNAHNVGVADYVHNYLYTRPNPAQSTGAKVRHTVEGFPIILYINGVCQGIYDFNLDRYSYSAYGYDVPEYANTCRSYEISANSNSTAGAFIKWDASKGVDEHTWYASDFRGIYPPSIQTASNDDYALLKNLISFVADSTDDVFRDEFDIYFDRESVFRYYILVMLLGAVDSLGKNAKLTTFDGIKWYFQFYDLDTIFGLDNSGAEKYDVDIEMEEGTFNTYSSTLWVRVRELFKNELLAEYTNMRNEYLKVDKFMECIFEKQIERIPQRYYNLTTQLKYLDFGGSYLMVSYGNRYYSLKRWINERFLFMDTLMGYTATTSNYATVRAGIEGDLYFEIQTYSPMYVTIKWRNEQDGKGTTSTKVGRDKVVRITGTTKSKDQEILIYGAEYIKKFGSLVDIKPTHLLLNQAKRLIELDCQNDEELIELQISECSYLQSVKVNGCSKLGVLTSSQVLDVSGCDNLRYLNAYGTQVTTIDTNSTGGNLVEMYVPKTLTTLSLKNQYSLTTLGLPCASGITASGYDIKNNGTNIANFSLINCPLITRLTYNATPSINGDAYDFHSNRRTTSELANIEDYEMYKHLSFVGNGLAKADNIYIENSCINMEGLSFRGAENLKFITLRDLPNLKHLLIGSNRTGNNWEQYSKGDLIGSFDYDGLTIKDCPNIETFRFHDFQGYPIRGQNNGNNNYSSWIDFTQDTLDLESKFPNLKVFSCNMPTQNLSTIILPDTMKSICINGVTSESMTDRYHYWTKGKMDLQNIYFKSDYPNGTSGIHMGNRYLTETTFSACPKALVIDGLNIKNEYVNPKLQALKVYGDEHYPMIKPKGKIDVSTFKWKNISGWFTNVDVAVDTGLTYVYPNWDELINNITSCDNMFYRCTNKDFDWKFAMKFFPKINGRSALGNMYKYAILKEQTSYESDAVDMINTLYDLSAWGYNDKPFVGTNLKYVKSVKSSKSGGCYGLFQEAPELERVGDCTFTGTSSSYFENMFNNCPKLKSVGNINVNHTSAMDCSNMFYGCKKLTSIGNLNFKVSQAENFFRDCSSMTTLPLPDLSRVINMNDCFRGCSKITTINLSDITESTPLQQMANTFNGCTNLRSVKIGSNRLPNTMTTMSGCYYGCTNLTNILNFPIDPVDYLNLDSCCYNCDALTDNKIPLALPTRINNTNNMFAYCDGLKNVEIEIPSNSFSAYGMFRGCNNITSAIVKMTGDYCSDMRYIFDNCKYLTNVYVKFPKRLAYDEIYQTGMSYHNMFSYCSRLTDVELDMTSLQNSGTYADFGWMFRQSKSIQNVTGLDLTYVRKTPKGQYISGYSNWDGHSFYLSHDTTFENIENWTFTGALAKSYNFPNIRNIDTIKSILRSLDTVVLETLGLAVNVVDLTDETIVDDVDTELQQLVIQAKNKGWTFTVV